MATVVHIPKDTRWGDIGQGFGEGLGGGYLAEFQKEEERRKQQQIMEWEGKLETYGSREKARAALPVQPEDDEDRIALEERLDKFYPREAPERHVLMIPNEKDPEAPPTFEFTDRSMYAVEAPPGSFPLSQLDARLKMGEMGIKESESKTKRRQGDETLRQGAKGLGVQRYNAETTRGVGLGNLGVNRFRAGSERDLGLRSAGTSQYQAETARGLGLRQLQQGAEGLDVDRFEAETARGLGVGELGTKRYNAQTGRREQESLDDSRMAQIDRGIETNVEDEAARRAQNEIDWARLELDTKKAQAAEAAAKGSDLFENAEKRNNAYVISSDLAGRADAPEFADIDKSHIPVPGSDEALMRGHFINSTRGDVLKVLTASQSKWFAGFGQAFAVENKQLLQEAIARTEGNMFFGVNPMPVGLAIREADAWATAKAARLEALGSVEAEKPGELTTFIGKSTEGAEDNPYQVPAEFSKSRAETLEWIKHNAETLRGKYFVNPETGQTTLLPEDLE